MLAVNHVVGVGTPGSAPIKRMIQETKARGAIIDMTSGRKTKAVVFLDTGGIVLAAITPETIASRIQADAHRCGEGRRRGVGGASVSRP